MPFSILAVAAAAVSAFVIGGVWYSPLLLGKAWQRLVDLPDEALSAGLARTFIVSGIASVVMALNLAAFIGPDAGVGFAAFAGAAAGLGWVAPALGITFAFERRPVGLWLVDAGYHAVAFTVMGVLIGLLQ